MQWTRSPPDLHHEHVLNRRNKWMRLMAYLATRGRLESVQSSRNDHVSLRFWKKKDGTTLGLTRAGDHDQTATMHLDLLLTVATRGPFWSAGSSSNGRRKTHQNDIEAGNQDRPTYLIKSDGGRKRTKNHDQRAIVAPLRQNQGNDRR